MDHSDLLLSQCGDDIRTTGHVELIMMADQLVQSVLNGKADAAEWAEGYRQMRVQAASQAFAKRPAVTAPSDEPPGEEE